MKAAVILLLTAVAAITQHASCCVTPKLVETHGCTMGLGYVKTPKKLNVCGLNRPSCLSNGEGIVDGSVEIKGFKNSQCALTSSYYNPNFLRGNVVDAHIQLTGKQLDSNGQEQDFAASFKADTWGYIYARPETNNRRCVAGLSTWYLMTSPVKSFKVEGGDLSEGSEKSLITQLPDALTEVLRETINSARI